MSWRDGTCLEAVESGEQAVRRWGVSPWRLRRGWPEASARVRVFNLFFILMGGERKWGGNAIGIVCCKKSQYLCVHEDRMRLGKSCQTSLPLLYSTLRIFVCCERINKNNRLWIQTKHVSLLEGCHTLLRLLLRVNISAIISSVRMSAGLCLFLLLQADMKLSLRNVKVWLQMGA